MTIYDCTICSFSSKKKFDYEKHKKTKKHITALKNSTNIDNIPNYKTNKTHSVSANVSAILDIKHINYECELCKTHFTHSSSLSRHKKNVCKKNPDALLAKKNDNDAKMKLIERKNTQLETKNKHLLSEISKITSELNGIHALFSDYVEEQKKRNSDTDETLREIHIMCRGLYAMD